MCSYSCTCRADIQPHFHVQFSRRLSSTDPAYQWDIFLFPASEHFSDSQIFRLHMTTSCTFTFPSTLCIKQLFHSLVVCNHTVSTILHHLSLHQLSSPGSVTRWTTINSEAGNPWWWPNKTLSQRNAISVIAERRMILTSQCSSPSCFSSPCKHLSTWQSSPFANVSTTQK